MKNLFLTILFLMLLISCGEDKHPELPIFSTDFSEDLLIEELESDIKFITDTDDFIYLFDGVNKNMIIRSQKTKGILKTLATGEVFDITEEGNIYFGKEYKAVYKAMPPNFDVSSISIINIPDLTENGIEKSYKDEMERLNIKYDSDSAANNEDYFQYIEKKRREYIENTFLEDYESILSGESFDIIKYHNGKEYYFHGMFYVFERLPENTIYRHLNESRSENSDFINNSYSIEEFDDSVLLSFAISGGNHFVPGIHKKSLYYYELKIGKKSIKFKSHHPVEKTISFDDEILITTENKNYKMTLK